MGPRTLSVKTLAGLFPALLVVALLGACSADTPEPGADTNSQLATLYAIPITAGSVLEEAQEDLEVGTASFLLSYSGDSDVDGYVAAMSAGGWSILERETINSQRITAERKSGGATWWVADVFYSDDGEIEWSINFEERLDD